MSSEIKIILVDDVAETRESIKKLLAFESDFKVIGTADNGRRGVEVAVELEPDIIIMDINMPDMDGLEAASRITKAVPTAGVIMMSVQSDQDYMQRAMLAGARFFMPKPVTMDLLYSTIRNVYDQYAPVRAQFEALKNQQFIMPLDDEEEGAGDRAGHVIVVYSPQGGVGCTTVATSIASGLMKDGIKSLLIDCDLQFGDVGAFLDLRPQLTIADLAENADDLDIEYFESVVATHNSGIKVLMGPNRPMLGADIRDTYPEAIPNIISQISSFYDFIVVDTSRSIDPVTASLLEMATKVVLVSVPTLPCVKNIKLVLDWFDQTGFPPEKVALVLNKAIETPSRAQRSIPSPERIQQYLKRPIEGLVPLVDETVILNSINKGIPVIASDRDTSKPPIKNLMKFSDHLYSSMMGTEEIEEVEEDDNTRTPWGLFSRK